MSVAAAPSPGTVRRWLAALGAVALLSAQAAFAQGKPVVTLAASSLERCLAGADGAALRPEYPAEALRLKRSANVNVEFVFEAPDRAPQVHFLAPLPEADFRASVEHYASRLRLPCMTAGAGAATLRQGFDFVPNDGRKVAWTAPVDMADRVREETLKCLRHPQGDDAQIRYPQDMLHKGHEQIVMARMRFSAADQAAESEILFDGGRKSFSLAVRPYLDAMRLPCLPPGSTIDTVIKFEFRFSDVAHNDTVVNDLELRQFLGAVKAVPGDTVFFDTQSMKCPFDVRLVVGEPFEPNRVEVLEQDVPERRPLADWIARQTFGLTPDVGAKINGQPMNIHIPCARIDL